MIQHVKKALAGLALAAVAIVPLQPALAAGHKMTLYNGIKNVDVISLKVRGGTVSGFKRIPPLKGINVNVTTGDGKCQAWIVARVEGNAAATALVNTCGGAYAVVLRTQGKQYGTRSDLNIVPVK